jgi:hypothetical protein
MRKGGKPQAEALGLFLESVLLGGASDSDNVLFGLWITGHNSHFGQF